MAGRKLVPLQADTLEHLMADHCDAVHRCSDREGENPRRSEPPVRYHLHPARNLLSSSYRAAGDQAVSSSAGRFQNTLSAVRRRVCPLSGHIVSGIRSTFSSLRCARSAVKESILQNQAAAQGIVPPNPSLQRTRFARR